jgi:hypothetical protein
MTADLHQRALVTGASARIRRSRAEAPARGIAALEQLHNADAEGATHLAHAGQGRAPR